MIFYPSFLFANLLLGLFSALGFGWLALRLATHFDLMDVPGVLPHKQHAHPTPLAGGLTILMALVFGFLFNWDMARTLWPLWPPLLIVFAFGLWDDKSRLTPRIKLLGQVLAALLLLRLGVSVHVIKPSFLGLGIFWSNILNSAITLFWVVGLTNALNLIDSMDGLVVGISGVALAFMLLVVLSSGNMMVLRLLALLFGIVAGLYFYNAAPARFFLGDSGAQSLGYLLAVMALLFTPSGRPQASSWFVPVLILAVPIFDTSLVVFSRLRRGERPFHAGRDHTYHRLVALGFDSRRAVIILHLSAIMVGSLAFIAFLLPPLQANLIFIGLLVLALALFFWLERHHGH